MQDRRSYFCYSLSKRRCIYRVAVAITLTLNSAAMANSDWESWFKQGTEAAQQSQYEKSIHLFQASYEAAQRAQNKVQCLKSLDNLAQIHFRLGNFQKSEETYRTMLDLSPTNSTRLKLANVYRRQEKNFDAENVYEQYFAEARLNSGEQRMEYGQAASDYSRLLRKLGKLSRAAELEEQAKWLEASRPGAYKSPRTFIPRKGFRASPEAYASAVEEQIAQVYDCIGVPPNRRARVTFTVLGDGQVSNLCVKQGFQNVRLDQNALNAVVDAGPFPALPPGFPSKLEFDIEVPLLLRQRAK